MLISGECRAAGLLLHVLWVTLNVLASWWVCMHGFWCFGHAQAVGSRDRRPTTITPPTTPITAPSVGMPLGLLDLLDLPDELLHHIAACDTLSITDM